MCVFNNNSNKTLFKLALSDISSGSSYTQVVIINYIFSLFPLLVLGSDFLLAQRYEADGAQAQRSAAGR